MESDARHMHWVGQREFVVAFGKVLIRGATCLLTKPGLRAQNPMPTKRQLTGDSANSVSDSISQDTISHKANRRRYKMAGDGL